MDKQKLVDHIVELLRCDLALIKAAAQATYEAATGEESIAENQYDTRAIEASYLAGAQSERATEIEKSLVTFEQLKLKAFDGTSKIQSTALIDLTLESKKLCVFLVPAGGSLTVEFENRPIHIITPLSPLGEALIGLKAGEFATVEKGGRVLEYEIQSVS